VALELAGWVGGTVATLLETLWDAGSALAGTPRAKDWAAGLRERAGGRLPLPENHDLVRGIRTAHLAAIDKIARRHEGLLEDLPPQEVGREEGRFAEALRAWLDQRLKLLHAGGIDFAAVAEADVRQVLDEMVHPSAIEGYAEAAAQNRQVAEARALAEIAAALGTGAAAVPPWFRRLFLGEAGAPGWYEIFALFVNEKIKTDERFRAIFLAAELVDIKRLIAALDRRIAQALLRGVVRLDRIEAKVDAVKDDTTLIIAMVQELTAKIGATDAERAALAAEVERLRGAEALTAQAIAGFLRALGEQEVAPGDYPGFLPRLAERYRALREEAERRTQLPAALEAERARAREAIEAGDLEGADAILRRIAARIAAHRREQQEAWQQSCREEAALTTERAAIATTRLRYREAAALHAEAAALLAFDAAASWAALMEAAKALYDHGSEFGDNDALREAIATYGSALALAPRDRVPLDWARTQNYRGNALATLGDRESGTELLEEAVAAYRAALEERTRDRVPLDCAMTQNNLGNALLMLGERESGTELLEAAVAAYRAALEEKIRDRVPLQWAMTQNNLGAALRALGERESGTARLEEAVAAYRAALEERSRDRVPLDWAMTQNNLGTALQTLGERESGTARLEDAVAAYRAALEEWTRDRVPLDWAMTQNNLGAALQTLGERESGTARLEEAVAAYRAALEERTRDRVPLNWAMTQNNLGNALATLGARESGTELLEEAVAAHRAALEEWTRDRVPFDWARTQNNLGTALLMLGERESGTARLEEAVAAYRAALEEMTRDRVPLDWAMTQNNLGNALATLGERESGTARLEEAVAATLAALEERTRDRVPFLWAQTMENLALAEESWGDKARDAARWRTALRHVELALEAYLAAGAEYYIAKATRLRDRLNAKLAGAP
jgi:hypothetical protein